MEFRARAANNSFNEFITFFGERGVKVRCLNKMIQGYAKAAGYHSVTNVEATNKYIDDKVNAKMANLAAAVKAAMDDRVLDVGQ